MAALLQEGASGDEVAELQRKLAELGFWTCADGWYGPKTKRLVQRLQTMFGHTPDGIVSDATITLIDEQLESRALAAARRP